LRFSDLPLRTRTALVSVGYQKGYYLPKTASDVWDALVAKDWNGLVTAFNDFGGSTSERRKREGALVQQDIDSGLLK
ncbi:pesticin C-terminus-like muramidase, partial [Escherichia coli]|nr:peptidase [Escherichia coli]